MLYGDLYYGEKLSTDRNFSFFGVFGSRGLIFSQVFLFFCYVGFVNMVICVIKVSKGKRLLLRQELLLDVI